MYTFSQLLIRNFLLGLLFLAIMFLSTFFLLSQYLNTLHNQHQQTVSLLITEQQNGEFDGQAFGKKLLAINPYLQLSISDNNQVSLFSHNGNSKTTGLSLVSPESTTVKVGEPQATITFQQDFSVVFVFVIQALVILSALTAAFIFIAAWSSDKRNKRLFTLFSDQIKNEISSILKPNKDANSGDIFEIPALKDGLKEIHELIELEKEHSNSLKEHAYIDPLTHLNNRNRFIQYFEDTISTDANFRCGVLVMTRCSELQTINQIHGYTVGDQYITAVADMLKSSIANYKSAKLFRLNSSDFAAIIPNVRLKEAENYTKEITNKFNDYQQASDLDSVAYSGLVYFEQDKPLGELLALADTGISVAQTQHINSWYSQKDNDIASNTAANYGNQNWRQEIESVIANKRVTLLVQHIQPNNRNMRVYGEILARFLNTNDEMLPTASFIAMAEKLDKIVEVDKLIIETAITEITNKNLQDHSFGINISSRTIHDEQFIVWLERRLLREPNISSRLIFEISEYGLQQNIRASKRFIDMMHRVGSRVTVERFGVGLTSFKFFRELKPDFIKMDSTYTRDIDDDKNNQYFLRLMVDLAHRLSINVLAESVESQEEKHTLEKLFIDGCQGFYIGKPTKM
ncbi:EAL domain-containing protein [Thalassotalea sp. PLHSN55]|uniref:EAL domain-containing protein n=1 Tax=Thalassotalea sp. PLHSN55 TaxID=3435888 RepID=UPI003F87C31C